MTDPSTPEPDKARVMAPSDYLLLMGVAAGTTSVAGLAGPWWALLVPAAACVTSGIARARAGG